MRKKDAFKLGLTLLLALALGACQTSGGSKSVVPADDSTSQQAGDDSSDQGTSDQGTSDQGTSDQGTSDQGTSDQGTSDQGSDSSEEELVKSFTVTSMQFEKKADNKVYLQVGGTQENHTADEFKWAWGLASGSGESITFLYGSATPAAADFKAATFDANKAFAVELCLSDVPNIVAGTYTVYGGTPETYRAINPVNENSSAKDGSFKYYIRIDLNQICLDDLPVVAFEEASVYIPSDLPTGKQAGVYVKIGGTVKAGVDVDTLTVKADFQRISPYAKHPNNGAFPENEMFWVKDAANGKAYINLYVGFMAVGEKWATHLGFNTNNNPNCYMANDINDVEYRFADEDINKVYTVNAKESEGQQGTYWGCLGFNVTREHEPAPAKTHTWVAAADGANSDGKVIKNYTCSDANCNAVCAGIALKDASKGADKIGSDGKISTNSTLEWKIVAPKAGKCIMMMAAKLSSAYLDQDPAPDTPFNSGYSIAAGTTAGTCTLDGKKYESDLHMNGTDYTYFEVGTLTVESGENVIQFKTPSSQNYRACFGGEVRLVFEA